MLRIGITGGIGSGKSTVCRLFSLLGIPVFDADTVAKQAYYDKDTKPKVIQLLGQDIYTKQGIDRKKVAGIVFSSKEKLEQLNHVIHPWVQEQFEDWCQKQKSVYVLKEAALLIESGSYKTLDKLILVTCPLSLRIQRVIERDKSNEEEVRKRIQLQMSEEEKRSYCDFEIMNDEKQLLIPQVLKLHERMMGLN